MQLLDYVDTHARACVPRRHIVESNTMSLTTFHEKKKFVEKEIADGIEQKHVVCFSKTY